METKYYTPEMITEFYLYQVVQINRGEWKLADNGEENMLVDNWRQELVTSENMKMIEQWYMEKLLYKDIDLSKRIRVEVKE